VREIRRVLVPGGRAVVLELTVPPGWPAHTDHRLYTARLVPLAGRLIARNADAYRYLVASVRQFPQAVEFLATMSAAGFSACRHVPLLGGSVTVFVGG
jgi:demethylmenaquinone methyltransferase/2-methoxy-6-polyprenyl-1,4-benzoquinol methylase